MFTGIIEAVGRVTSLQKVGSDWQLVVSTAGLSMDDVKLGDSIAVNGCCLTVVAMSAASFTADVSNESMECTSFSDIAVGASVNLEKAMLATSRFGGHIVSGHVDGVGKIVSMVADGLSQVISIEAPQDISHYIAGKGSVCVDGTSLTVNRIKDSLFEINIIPHTQQETIIGQYKVGQAVNLEVDLIARYLERLMTGSEGDASHNLKGKTAISRDFLTQNGF